MSEDVPEPATPDPYPDDTLTLALVRHGIDLPPEQVALLARYAERLWDWNTKINLTRHTTFEKFVTRDVVDSLKLAEKLAEGEHVLDVGSGGGVPGILLAILRPDLAVSLIDSVAKKAKVLEELVRDVGLSCEVFHDRAEEHLASWSYQTLVVRAVAPMPKLLGWLKGRWGSFRRMLVIKGPAWKDECAAAKAEGLTGRLDIHRVAEYPLPGTESTSVILEVLPRGRKAE